MVLQLLRLESFCKDLDGLFWLVVYRSVGVLWIGNIYDRSVTTIIQ